MTRNFKLGFGIATCALLYGALAGSSAAVVSGITIAVALLVIYIQKKRTASLALAQLGAPPKPEGATQRVGRAAKTEHITSTIETVFARYAQVTSTYRVRRHSHRIDDMTCECLREIVKIDPLLGPAPYPGEYLRQWQQRVQSPAAKALASEVKQRLQERELQLEADEKRKNVAEGQRLIENHKDLVQRFLEIAERKISVLDDYGDERVHLLPKEVDACVVKIAGREGLAEVQVRKYLKDGMTFVLSPPLQWVHSRLPELFNEYHTREKDRERATDEVMSLTGQEFETYLARLLKQAGWQVSATPISGDQGADLIVSKDSRHIAIQAKRYAGSVGNHAIQEVVAAVRFYNCTEGCVITNSRFTHSARELAQKNNIKLIDGMSLENIKTL